LIVELTVLGFEGFEHAARMVVIHRPGSYSKRTALRTWPSATIRAARSVA
jgi:hypothetical protein